MCGGKFLGSARYRYYLETCASITHHKDQTLRTSAYFHHHHHHHHHEALISGQVRMLIAPRTHPSPLFTTCFSTNQLNPNGFLVSIFLSKSKALLGEAPFEWILAENPSVLKFLPQFSVNSQRTKNSHGLVTVKNFHGLFIKLP